MEFKASDTLLKLAARCKRRVIEPSLFEDYFEQYAALHGPKEGQDDYEWKSFALKTRMEAVRTLYNGMSGTEINAIALCVQAVRSVLKDQRQDELRIVYPVDVIVIVILLAKLCGKNTAQETAEFYKHRYLELLSMIDGLPSPKHMPSPTTFKRVMRLLSADDLNTLLRTYFKPSEAIVEKLLRNEEQRERPAHADRHTIGFDGQEVTGSFRRGESSRRKKGAIGVTAFDCTAKTVLACKAVDKKNHEADAFLELLPTLGVDNGIFYADALNTSAKVSRAILHSGGDFVFNIKSNAGNKELREHLGAIFSREYSQGDSSALVRPYIQKGHGRIETVTVKVLPASKIDARIKNEHEGVQTIAEYAKECVYLNNGKVVKETNNTRYYISSLAFTKENADQILYTILDYWSCEQHHSRCDDPKVFNQDAVQSCSFDYLSSLLGINKVAYNVLTWIRQDMISASEKKSYVPSYSMVQDRLNRNLLFYAFRYLAKYFQQAD